MHNPLYERQERESGSAGVLMAGGTMDRVTLVTPMSFETRIRMYTDVTDVYGCDRQRPGYI
jgi:hypothetical protein